MLFKFSKGNHLWCSDKEKVVEHLINEIDHKVRFKSYTAKSEVRELIDTALSDCEMYEQKHYESNSKLGYRLLYLVAIFAQFLLIPYCAIKWLCGKGWYLPNDSKISHLMRKIDINK